MSTGETTYVCWIALVRATVALPKQSSRSSALASRRLPLKKPHPVCTMMAMRAVAPAADEEVVMHSSLPRLYESHVEQVGYERRFGCTQPKAVPSPHGGASCADVEGRLEKSRYLQQQYAGLSEPQFADSQLFGRRCIRDLSDFSEGRKTMLARRTSFFSECFMTYW